MEPTRNLHATLVDLLDRVLDKGLVIHADLIVSVAGVPLIGVSLKAALAGMETMLKYGMFSDWDECTRAQEREHRNKEGELIGPGEETILEMLGSYYYSEGIYTAWRAGHIYLTNRRLILYHPGFEDILLETPLESILGLAVERETHLDEERRQELRLILKGDKVVRLHAVDIPKLKEVLEQRLSVLGLAWREVREPPLLGEETTGFSSREASICSS